MTGSGSFHPLLFAPSRSRLAIFRLAGFLLLRFGTPGPPPRPSWLASDRNQNPVEAWTTGSAMYLLFAILSWGWLTSAGQPLITQALFLLAALVLALVCFNVLLLVIGGGAWLLRRAGWKPRRHGFEIQERIFHLVALAAAIAAVTLRLRTRWAGYVWIGLWILDISAAMVMWLIRRSVDALEKRCEFDTSAL
ncbi:MAG: hypothetical protein WBX15_10690 [Thermoanaerobaculia bacterium]